MARLILWNSIAPRRRSISDTFYDNGLGTLKAYLEQKGHDIEIVDSAREDVFDLLTFKPLARFIRRLYVRVTGGKKRSGSRNQRAGNGIGKALVGAFAMQLQEVQSWIQRRRFRKYLRDLAVYVKNSGVRVFGIKMWYGEAFANANDLIREIQRIAPHVITIAGGYHPTLYGKDLMQHSPVDLGVVCEGEFALESILDLVEEERNWELGIGKSARGIAVASSSKTRILSRIGDMAEAGEIENVLYRKDGVVDASARRQVGRCNSKVAPEYDMNQNKVGIHVIVESLGCSWGKCNFCVHEHFYPKYSARAVDEIVKEIKVMQQQGIGMFRFAGSDTPPAFGAKIAQKILDNDLNIVFGMGSRAIPGAKNRFEKLVEWYEVLIRAGWRAVFMGGETGNDFVNREVMNKGVCSEDLVHTIRAIREAEKRAGHKVFISLGLIYPTPLLGKISLEEVKADNVRLLTQAKPDSVLITPPGPFVHTKWNTERDGFGFELDEDFIKKGMEYEYVLYKPPEFWPELGMRLEGKPLKQLLEECNDFRKVVEHDLKIPTDVSDEHFLMFYAAGITKKEAILAAKRETMLDILSCDYAYTFELSSKVNEFSEALSGHGMRIPSAAPAIQESGAAPVWQPAPSTALARQVTR